MRGKVKIVHVRTESNVSDILTKVLTIKHFQRLRDPLLGLGKRRNAPTLSVAALTRKSRFRR